MARRTTPLTKRRAAARETAQADVSEQVAAKAPRRGKRAKLHDIPAGEMSVTDAFFPGGEDLAASVTDTVPSEPAKARRGRKPKSQPTPEPVTTEGDPTRKISAPAADATSVEGNERPDVVEGYSGTPPARRKRRGGHEQVDVPATTDASAASTALQPSAAEWTTIPAPQLSTGPASSTWRRRKAPIRHWPSYSWQPGPRGPTPAGRSNLRSTHAACRRRINSPG